MNQEGMRRVRARRAIGRERRPETALLGAVLAAFGREASRLGVGLSTASPGVAARSRRLDPVSGDESLVCDWCDEWGRRSGGLVVNPDGSFYAEQEVAVRSADRQRVVHLLRAWGRGVEDLHSEACTHATR